MTFEDELDLYLRARVTLIFLVTREEERALRLVKSVCERSKRPCLVWDLADDFQVLAAGDTGAPPATKGDAVAALNYINDAQGNAVFVLRDFHDHYGFSKAKRKLRSVAQQLKYNTTKSILIVTPLGRIPEELKDEAVVLNLKAPGAADIEALLNRLVGNNDDVKVDLTPLGRERLVQAARGMTEAQALRVFSKAIVREGRLDDRDIELVSRDKKEIIRESEALEFYSSTESPDHVGGLGVMKRWLELRASAFTQEARDYGLPAPKGILLIGIPGTGKSLTAKMIGGLWQIPLLRLDMGSLFGSLVGESEERTRRALRLAETIAPCVLWVDEIEKGLAAGDLDGGTSRRVLGSMLTWMQEKVAPCFVVATANDVSRLPLELMRKGRFDEIFFLDLPTLAERRDIVSVHLTRRGRSPQDFDVGLLAKLSEGYVGAEIEQSVVEAMYSGFSHSREFTTQDVADALRRQVPLSRSEPKRIEELRALLLGGRAQSASFQEAGEAERQFVRLQIGP